VSIASHLAAVQLDCPDPRALAAFYRALTGRPAVYEDDDFAVIGPEAESAPGARPYLNFERVEGYTPPRRPG
jgi:hypothetical protein